jgi:hypothetical protein
MAKRITLTSSKTNPFTPWYWQTTDAANNEAWQQREQFMVEHPEITYTPFATDTTMVVEIEIADETVYQEFVAITENIAPGVLAYCDANGITYSVVTEDV